MDVKMTLPLEGDTAKGSEPLSASARGISDHTDHPAPGITPAIPGPTPARILRTRPSTLGQQTGTVRSSPRSPAPSTSVRAPTNKELELIRRKLAPEATYARREELLKEKEAELREVVDEHDTVVREKFHLERFITMITGWDPKLAKEDNAPVFLDYKRYNHNLFDLAPQAVIPANAVAGPSRSRPSAPSRTTRQRVHDQEDLFSSVRPTPANPSLTPQNKGKGRSIDTGGAVDVKIGIASDVASTDGKLEVEGRKSHGKGKGRIKEERASAPFSLEPRGKKGRASAIRLEDDGELLESEAASASLASTPIKRGPGRPPKVRIVEMESSTTSNQPGSPAPPIQQIKRGPGRPPKMRPVLVPEDEPEMVTDDAPNPTELENVAASPPPPAPSPMPSLAHIPFPPPPVRARQRRTGPNRIWYTEPQQLPHPAPPHHGDLSSLLTSYILLEDTGPPPDLKSLEIKAAREGFIRNRVNYLQSQGRLLRLLEEEADDTSGGISTATKFSYKQQPLPLSRKQDHQDHLMAHMRQVRNAMLEEAKNRPVFCKRIARMITAYWEHLQGKDARDQLEVERELKRRSREIVRALKKRWGLAVKIIRARMLEAQKAEQDRLGKAHLQDMLQRSTGLLEAQQQVGNDDDSDDEEEDEDEDDDGDEEGGGDHDESDLAAATSDVEADEDEPDISMADDGNFDKVDIPPLRYDVVNENTPGSVDARLKSSEEGSDVDGDGTEEQTGDDASGTSSEGGNSEDDGHLDHLRALLDSPGHGGQVGEETAGYSGPFAVDSTTAQVELEPGRSAPTAASLVNGHVQQANGRHADSTSPGVASSADAIARSALESPEPIVVNGYSPEPRSALQPNENPSAMEEVILQPPLATGDTPDPTSSPLNGLGDLPNDKPLDFSAFPSLRSRRARKVRVPPPSRLIEQVDPDADDIDFAANSDEDEIDQQMDIDMEKAEGDDAGKDSEDEGLLADADVPIEELLRRYGYDLAPQSRNVDRNVPIDAKHAVNSDQPVLEVDKSLLDANFVDPDSPLLVTTGKRQRRARQVWTPEDNPPHIPKKPKIEQVTPESTPDLSSDEESDAEEDEDVPDEQMEVEDDPNAPKTRPPFLLRGTLRPYQHAGLEWLASLYANNMNGILADEMGLGKTIQTISLLGHLACDRGVWGQHLIIVPTSVILNWEMEFKKFLPGFKVLTYYGNQKERKEKRVGWLTEHSWQVCITSYQIVLADQHIFRRKSWVYMILDEAHNIKNFRSQRWQTLLGFKAQRRLLLTGTPLQNNLMELWSLLYFLMPHGVAEEATAVVGFANHKEFMEWFSNPMDKAVESGDVLDEFAIATVAKLHTLLRPFILRRLKSEVETQLPGKFEHIVYCRLSKRQRFLYDEFMSRSSTKEALTSGGYMGVMNTLMQLRKVCNHPDLFEVRPVRTSFAMERSVVADFAPADILVRKRLLAARDQVDLAALNLDITSHEEVSGWTAYARRQYEASHFLPHAVEVKVKGRQPAPPKLDTQTVDGWLKYRQWAEDQASVRSWRSVRDMNRIRCRAAPIYGSTLLSMLGQLPKRYLPIDATRTKRDLMHDLTPPVASLVLSSDTRRRLVEPLVEKFAVVPPNATARDLASLALPGLHPGDHPQLLNPDFDNLHHASTKLQIAFPDSSLLQYDCGKLQKLGEMLRDLKSEGYRVLIFTQMTRVLDILEIFLNYNGHRYLRLDGSTKIEDRQIITERFNSDARIFCFIASSRSGGVGINLTGADTVFFYDSDWNPSMDRQCMDRAHRIGQTREVHIYRFVSSHTVEENMLKKANQKRLLDKVIIQEGDFTTEFFGRVDWRETLYDGEERRKAAGEEEKEGVEDVEVEDEPEAEEVQSQAPRRGEERVFANMVAEVEDEEDVQAARIALGEGEMDVGDFEAEGGVRNGPKKTARFDGTEKAGSSAPLTPGSALVGPDEVMIVDAEAGDLAQQEDDDDVGAVDEYMLRLVEWDWNWFSSFR